MPSPSRSPMHILVAGMVAASLLPALARADDKSAERNARRLQLQMQGLQQQVQDAQAAKARAEAEKAEVEKKLAAQGQELPRAQGALHRSAESLKASEAARAALQAKLAALEKQADEARRAAETSLAAKDQQIAALTRQRDTQQVQMQARYEGQVSQVVECVDHNQRLVKLNAELLDRYRRKGVAEAMKQGEPLLGLSDVQMFNIVQNYRDQAEANRVNPPANEEKPRP